jgi:hypothetical protein
MIRSTSRGGGENVIVEQSHKGSSYFKFEDVKEGGVKCHLLSVRM